MAVWSEVKYSETIHKGRLDSEYYMPFLLELENRLEQKNAVTLGELGDVICSAFYPAATELYESGDTPFLRCVDVINFPVLTLDQDYAQIPSDFIRNNKSIRCIKGGDIIITKVGSPCYAGLLDETMPSVAMSRTVLGLVNIKKELVDSRYLTLFLRSELGFNQLMRERELTIQYQLTLERTRSIKVYLPPMDTQRRIGDMLTNYLKKRKNSKELYQQAESLLLTELGLDDLDTSHELFYETRFSETQESGRFDAEYFQPKYARITNAIRNCSGTWDTLENLVNIRKCVEPGSEAYQESGIPFVRVSNLGKFEINDNNQKYLTEELYNQLSRYQPRQNEILLSKDASPGIAYHLRKEPGKFIPSGGILRLKLKDRERLNEEYLTLVLNSLFVQQQIERDTGGSVINHWTLSQVKRAMIPLLEKSKQEEIKVKVAASFDQRDESKRLLEEAKRMVEETVLGAGV